MSDEEHDVIIIAGLIKRHYVDESEELHVGDVRLACWAEDFDGHNLSVRYWVSDKPLTIEEAVEATVMKVLGYTEGNLHIHHSDTTGYLWTDEDFKVGGHDMMAEIESYEGQYLILEISDHGPGHKPAPEPLTPAKEALVEMIKKSGGGWLI